MRALATVPASFDTYVVPSGGIGIRTASGSLYSYVPANGADCLQAFAGTNSRGLLDSSATSRIATPLSIQFGSANGNSSSSYWQANAPHLADATIPAPATAVVVETGGNQYVGDLDGAKRVYWNSETKRLTLTHLAADKLVTGNPRVQLNGHPLPTEQWLRFYCHFELGSEDFHWPLPELNKNTILVFQIKGDNTAFPPLTLEVRNNTYVGDPPAGSPDDRLVDVVLLRRTANESTNEVVFRVNGLTRRRVHKFVIDFFPSFWGQGHTGLWFNGERVPQVGLLNEPHEFWVAAPNLYSSQNDLYHPMWGIYRTNYTVQAPDAAAIVWHRAEVQWKQGSVSSVPLQPDYS